LKFKRCHLGRREQPVKRLSDVHAAHNKAMSTPRCLHPAADAGGCEGPIVAAHSIQRNGGLSRIAKNGHVYCFTPDLPALAKGAATVGAKLIGLSKASTFRMMCSKHDDATFAPIEKHPFASTAENCFLTGYRALCVYLYARLCAADVAAIIRSIDAGGSDQCQRQIQANASAHEFGYKLALKHALRAKANYDRILETGSFSEARYHVVEFDRAPDIMCAGFMPAACDFDGYSLQPHPERREHLDQFAFTLMGTASGGVAIFSWLPARDGASERLVQTLSKARDDAKSRLLATFALSCFDNVCIAPHWWQRRTALERRQIEIRVMDNLEGNPVPNPLYHLPVPGIDWKITREISG
jgi:hypothetical protein